MAGPGSNKTGTRSNNTVRHNASKYKFGKPVTPLVSPTSAVGYSNQVAGLQQQYSGALALMRANIAKARGDFVLARQQNRTDAVAAMQQEYGGAADRGIIGSSIDLQDRAAIRTGLAQAQEGAVGARAGAISDARLGGIQALGSFYVGLGQVQAQKAAEESQLAVQQYQSDQMQQQFVQPQQYQAWFQQVLQKLRRGRRKDLAAANAAGAVPGNLQIPTYKPLP